MLKKAIYTPQQGYFVDGVLGNDANPGTSRLVPFKTLSKLSGKWLTKVGIARNSSLTSDNFAPNNGGVVFYAYGNGAKPILRNATPVSSASWTNVSGNIYSTTSALSFTGTVIWWDASAGAGTEGSVTGLIKGTAGSLTANQWAFSGGTLQVNIGRAPTATDVFEVPSSANPLVLINGKNNLTFQDLEFRYSGGDGVLCANVSAVDSTTLQRCTLGYANGGLLHGGTAAAWTNSLVDSCYFHDQYSQQNAFAMHCDGGASNGAVVNCTFRRIAGWAITCAETATLLRYNCIIDGGKQLVVAGGLGSPGVHTFIKIRQYNGPPEITSGDYRINIGTGLNVSTQVRIYNCSLAAGTMPTQHRGLLHGGGALDIQNFAMDAGWGIALNGSGATTYGGTGSRTTKNLGVCVTGNELFNWDAAGSTGTLNGTGDVKLGSNSPFTSPSAGDLSLGGITGSSLQAVGAVIAGVTNSATPDIGATGAI